MSNKLALLIPFRRHHTLWVGLPLSHQRIEKLEELHHYARELHNGSFKVDEVRLSWTDRGRKEVFFRAHNAHIGLDDKAQSLCRQLKGSRRKSRVQG